MREPAKAYSWPKPAIRASSKLRSPACALVLELGHAALAGAALGVGRTAAVAYALWAPPEPIRIAGTFGLLGRTTKVGGGVLLGAMAIWVAMSLALRS